MIEVVKAVPAPVKPAWIRSLLTAAAAEPEVASRLAAGWSLTVRISGDRELRRLNNRFLGEDRATDVLSFPSGEAGYLGDIVVSWPAVERQASEFGHAPLSELGLLCVHGLLHLLGWDHALAAEEKAMNRLTLAALSQAEVQPAPARLLTH